MYMNKDKKRTRKGQKIPRKSQENPKKIPRKSKKMYMNKFFSTGVRGIPRSALKKEKFSHAFLFLYEINNDTLCPKSNEWFQYFFKKDYFNKINIVKVNKPICPFGMVLCNKYYVLYEKESINEKITTN